MINDTGVQVQKEVFPCENTKYFLRNICDWLFGRNEKRKRVYISGPMTGHPDLNFPAFFAEAERQQALGHVVVNPAELNPLGTSWKDCMRRDIEELAGCDAIVLIDGWHLSQGAQLEMHIAHRLGLEIIFAEKVTP